MCVVSMVGDSFKDRWGPKFPEDWDKYLPTQPKTMPMVPSPFPPMIPPAITRKEFEDLKAEVDFLKDLLIRAKKYDEDNGEPDCELDEKIAFLRKVAKFVGVDLDEVFGK